MTPKDKLLANVLRKWMNDLVARLSEDDGTMPTAKRAHLVGKWNAYNEIREILEGEVPILEPAKKNKEKT